MWSKLASISAIQPSARRWLPIFLGLVGVNFDQATHISALVEACALSKAGAAGNRSNPI